MKTRAAILLLLLLAGNARAQSNSDVSVSLTPSVTYASVSGNRAKFRAEHWQRDGWTGGVDEFTLRNKLNKDWDLLLEGRAIFDEEDCRLNLQIAKEKVGYFRAGWTSFRSYSDNVGGFYRPFTTPAFRLPQDLILRNGKVFAELGLTLPNAPKLTLGYERDYRNGQKSLLEWGGVTEGPVTRNIFPSFKAVDETIDIVTVGIEHDIKDVHLADQFRYTHYRDLTTRTDSIQPVTIRERYTHDDFANVFRMDSHVKETIYWSLGYLFTSLTGNGNLNVATAPPLGPFDKTWLTRAIDIDRDSHVLDANLMFGPYAGFTINLGLQGELTDTHGFADALLQDGAALPSTNLIRSVNDKASLEETLGVRYTKLPFTTLYAEGRWTEQDLDLRERETDNAVAALTRATDTSIFRQRYTVGLNTAPLPRITFASRYRHSIYNNDYDTAVTPEFGYPGYITAQNFTTDELLAKLTWRAHSKINLSFSYQLVATDIRNHTAALAAPFNFPAGTVNSGNFDSTIYTFTTTVTPQPRLYLTGSFSLQDTRTATAANNNPSLTKYLGNVYSLFATAGYALDNRTDLTLEYTYSQTDNFRDNSAVALPLGLDNRRTGIIAGLTRQIRSNVIARLRYGFYEYNESGNGGLDNYRAHLVSANCTIRF